MTTHRTIISSLTSLVINIAILTTLQQQQGLVNAQTTTAATTTTTTTTPPLWSKTGCPPTWTPSTPLTSNSIVSLNSIVYQCKDGQQMGCSSWEPGNDIQNWSMVWSVLGSCSGTLQPTSEPTWTPTTGSPTWINKGCPAEWTGGVEYVGGSTVGYEVFESDYDDDARPEYKVYHAFECNEAFKVFCSQYPPVNSGFDTSLIWLDQGGCTGPLGSLIVTPTASPVLPDWGQGPCHAEWVRYTRYEAEDIVTVTNTATGTKVVYECTSPYNDYCALFDPEDEQVGKMCWYRRGTCTGEITPTPAPQLPVWSETVCPKPWDFASNYALDDKAAIMDPGDNPTEGTVYNCADPTYCHITPADEIYGNYGWEIVGRCNGAAPPPTPTLSPSESLWDNAECVQEFEEGKIYNTGELVSILTAADKGTVHECNGPSCYIAPTYAGPSGWTSLGRCNGVPPPPPAPATTAGCPADPFDAESAYKEGNTTAAVEIASNTAYVYTCKGQPYTGYCSMPGFEPGESNSDMGWTRGAAC